MYGILILFFIVIFIMIIGSALKEKPYSSQRPIRRPSNFITYFDSLPDTSQMDFMNQLDDMQRLQMMDILEHKGENREIPQDIIDNFNDWTQSEENKDINPYDSNSFDTYDSSSFGGSDFNDYNSGDSSSSDSSSWNDSSSGDSSSWSDSSSSYSDSSSSFSDSGSSNSGGGSDF